jgi:SAM-dependent methyltransferase
VHRLLLDGACFALGLDMSRKLMARVNRGILIVSVGIGVTAGVTTWWLLSRREGGACPLSYGWALDNPIRRVLHPPSQTIARMGLRPGMQVLEVGPGTGYLTLPVAQRLHGSDSETEPWGGGLTCLELQEDMLAHLQRRVMQAGLTNVTLRHGDVTASGLPGDAFDLAFLVTVLGEIPDKLAALAELRRCLKPGGVLSITEHLADPDFVSHRRLRRLAEAAGFVPVERRGTPWSYTANFTR